MSCFDDVYCASESHNKNDGSFHRSFSLFLHVSNNNDKNINTYTYASKLKAIKNKINMK